MKNFQFNKPKLNQGFSLIELLVAITILGVLSSLLLANLQGARERGRDTQRKSDLYQVRQALRLYYNDNQSYPDADGGGGISGAGWGEAFKSADEQTVYMSKLPRDPLGVTNYYYTKVNDDSFNLYACLENKSDDAGTANCGSLDCSSDKCFKITEE